MTARQHHLRHIILCSVLLLVFAAITWEAGPELSPLAKALGIAPLVLAGTFFFNRFQRGRRSEDGRADELGEEPAGSDARLPEAVDVVMLILGLACAAVALLAPSHLVAVVWIVPALAGSAGIHLEAIS